MNISENLKVLGKYLDQPAVIKKLYNAVPIALIISAAGFCAYDTYKSPQKERKKNFIVSFSTLAFTVASALLATRGLKIKGKQIFEGLIELPHKHLDDIKEALKSINPESKSANKIFSLIDKVKRDEVLKFSEVKILYKNLLDSDSQKRLIHKVIPDTHSHSPFKELGKLSLLGLIPVIGGVTGGVIGEKISKQDWKKNLPNKVKEASYQYLNNIFLCNVGAGIAMIIMNKLKVQSKIARFFAMLTGVVSVGVLAGSVIANFIGNNFINPLFDKNTTDNKYKGLNFKELNRERHPEPLDLCLHIDDIASVGFLSGLKWIGPILPFLYSVSGYRAGIGYRNGDKLN